MHLEAKEGSRVLKLVDVIIGLSPHDWYLKRDRIARNLGAHWGDPLVKSNYLENGRLNFAHIFDEYA